MAKINKCDKYLTQIVVIVVDFKIHCSNFFRLESLVLANCKIVVENIGE